MDRVTARKRWAFEASPVIQGGCIVPARFEKLPFSVDMLLCEELVQVLLFRCHVDTRAGKMTGKDNCHSCRGAQIIDAIFEWHSQSSPGRAF